MVISLVAFAVVVTSLLAPSVVMPSRFTFSVVGKSLVVSSAVVVPLISSLVVEPLPVRGGRCSLLVILRWFNDLMFSDS